MWWGLYQHTCTLQRGTMAAGAYGHTRVDWSSATETTVRCRLVMATRRELQNLGFANTERADYLLLLPEEEAPPGFGATGDEAVYRVVDVRDAEDNVIRAGPLDVEAVQVVYGVGGIKRAYRLALRAAE